MWAMSYGSYMIAFDNQLSSTSKTSKIFLFISSFISFVSYSFTCCCLFTACEFIFHGEEQPGFKCLEINWCIPKHHLCNSVPNCPQGSDEDVALCKSK